MSLDRTFVGAGLAAVMLGAASGPALAVIVDHNNVSYVVDVPYSFSGTPDFPTLGAPHENRMDFSGDDMTDGVKSPDFQQVHIDPGLVYWQDPHISVTAWEGDFPQATFNRASCPSFRFSSEASPALW